MRKISTIQRDIEKCEKARLDRISKGRTRGAGAGGFNRDVDNIVHKIRLLREELKVVAHIGQTL